MMQILTKSNYILGLECPKYLWLKVNHPEKIKEPSVADKFRMEDGEKVGIEAKKLFPEGIDLSMHKYNENPKKTKEALKEKKPLFEAGFEFNNLFSRADILFPVDNEWDIVEVKASTKTKKVNIYDVAFQKYVYEGSGIKIRKCFILHLNKDYTKYANLNLEKLFEKEEITKEVNELIGKIPVRINNIIQFLSQKEPPKAGLILEIPFSDGSHDCKTENCLELPENNVFCLYRCGKLGAELYEKGIKLIKDITEEIKLNAKQSIQRTCEKEGKVNVDKEKIKEFLDKLQYPLHYLDFETFNTAIPMFDGTRPYSQIPFQFSLHTVEKENGRLVHYEFLYNGKEDPRKDFITALNGSLGEKGTIIVYNQSFEINRMKELAVNFPEYKAWVENIPLRTVDLLDIFREFSYYNPKQQGSASIKKVLPALTGKTYKGMAISDGGTASVEFFNAHYTDTTQEKRKQVREDLLKYCGLDTEAEIMIIDKLRELVKEKLKLEVKSKND